MSPVLFVILAAMLIVSALGVVLQRSPIRCALALVTTLFVLAVIFLFLDAQLVAALQVIVYAGAIMVLFLFVIMLLNLQQDVRAMAWLGARVVAVLMGSLFLLAAVRFFVYPLAPRLGPGMGGAPPEGFGSTEQLGQRLFTHYLFAFEITSVLLLVAIIGAVVLAKRKLA
ncbi:MAG: NADH-quinone oxidoreductase subunit J [Candidatus Binatia bacterium]